MTFLWSLVMVRRLSIQVESGRRGLERGGWVRSPKGYSELLGTILVGEKWSKTMCFLMFLEVPIWYPNFDFTLLTAKS